MTSNRVAISTSSFGLAGPEPLEKLRQHGLTVAANPHGRRLTRPEIKDHLRGVVGLLAGLEPLDRDVLESASDLRALARVGIGMDNVDVEAAAELGIAVSNTPDAPTRAVAEMTLAAALSLCRQIPAQSSAVHSGAWAKTLGRSLSGMTVLIVGWGRIGRAVGRHFEILGASVLISDPFLPEGASSIPLLDALPRADMVTLHAAGADQIIGQRELAAMRPGAFLLNSARGGIVDEVAALESLESGHLGGLWLDVYSEEPYTGPLLGQPRALLTPHASTYTRECRSSMEREAVDNLLADLGLAAS